MIDPDVQAIAATFAASADFARLIQAVVTAEGNIVKAVACSEPAVTTREQAIRVVCRSAIHAMSDFLTDTDAARPAFVQFWARRWAPVGASNDPSGLNANWPKNVEQLWLRL